MKKETDGCKSVNKFYRCMRRLSIIE